MQKEWNKIFPQTTISVKCVTVNKRHNLLRFSILKYVSKRCFTLTLFCLLRLNNALVHEVFCKKLFVCLSTYITTSKHYYSWDEKCFFNWNSWKFQRLYFCWKCCFGFYNLQVGNRLMVGFLSNIPKGLVDTFQWVVFYHCVF